MTNSQPFYIIAHNIRSLYNVGTIFRTADGLGVDKVYLTGYTGTPPRREISKVALGADDTVEWQSFRSLSYLLTKLKKSKVQIVALETGAQAKNYLKFKPRFPVALIIGNEVDGLSAALLTKVDKQIFIPMHGIKESLNVGIAMGVAGYHIASWRY